jgi:hypothetical protein
LRIRIQFSTPRVITDTEWAGSSTSNADPALICDRFDETASGVEKLFATDREGAVTL